MLKVKNFIFLNEYNDRDSVSFQNFNKSIDHIDSTKSSNKSSSSENSDVNI